MKKGPPAPFAVALAGRGSGVGTLGVSPRAVPSVATKCLRLPIGKLSHLLPVSHWSVLRKIRVCPPAGEGRTHARSVRGEQNMSQDVRPSQDAPRLGEPELTNKLMGGIIIAVIALLLFAGAFYVSNPFVPAAMALAVAVVGIATAVGLMPVRAPQDFYGGLALVLLATFALIASAELPGQRGFAFGPGTAPRLFAILLAAIGALVALVGVLADGPRIEKYKIRGP